MQFFDAEQVHARCDYPALVEALERAHQDDVDVMDDLLLSNPQSGSHDHFFIRAAWQSGRALGAKLIAGFFDTPMRRIRCLRCKPSMCCSTVPTGALSPSSTAPH